MQTCFDSILYSVMKYAEIVVTDICPLSPPITSSQNNNGFQDGGRLSGSKKQKCSNGEPAESDLAAQSRKAAKLHRFATRIGKKYHAEVLSSQTIKCLDCGNLLRALRTR
jgi:hypothetical protein